MEGEDVFASKISLQPLHSIHSASLSIVPSDLAPSRQMIEAARHGPRHFTTPFPPPPNPALVAPPRLIDFATRCDSKNHEEEVLSID